MRTLEPSPAHLFDPATRAPNLGSFRGPLPRIDLTPLGKGPLFRLAHWKRWVYVAIATDELIIGAAIVDLTYATSGFSFAYERGGADLSVSISTMGHPLSARVGHMTGEGCLAFFKAPGNVMRFNQTFDKTHHSFSLGAEGLRVDAQMQTGPSPIAVIAKIPGGVLNATEKRSLMDVRGEAIVRGRRFSLDGGLGGFDYTHGYLARHTKWRWAYLLGHAQSGERVGMNLVQGFVGEPECAIWVDNELFPVGEGQITCDPESPRAPWFVTTTDGSVDLRFEPRGVHSERKNYGVLKSQFIQPAGLYRGTLKLPDGRVLELDGVLGVAENQDMLW